MTIMFSVLDLPLKQKKMMPRLHYVCNNLLVTAIQNITWVSEDKQELSSSSVELSRRLNVTFCRSVIYTVVYQTMNITVYLRRTKLITNIALHGWKQAFLQTVLSWHMSCELIKNMLTRLWSGYICSNQMTIIYLVKVELEAIHNDCTD